MKILVVDDNPIHRDAAQAQLGQDHNLTVVRSYDMAELRIGLGGLDVVLVDLMMPPSERGLNDEGMRFANEEMPIGIFLALLAAKNGTRFVGVLTDANHHTHPASHCFDAFNGGGDFNPPTPIEGPFAGTRMMLANCPWLMGWFRPENLGEEVTEKTPADETLVRTKNWRLLLEYLTK